MNLPNWFDWFPKPSSHANLWMVFGKGPTFARRHELVYNYWHTMGLNHVCRREWMEVTHVIDIDVIADIPDIDCWTETLVMPWHPHVQFNASKRSLPDFFKDFPVLEKMAAKNRLVWYNLSTGTPHGHWPVVAVQSFSAEAAIRLLAMAGVKTIRTVGVDGGSSYAKEFSHLKPFRGGHTTFNLQWEPIQRTVAEFELDFRAMFPPEAI